MSDHHPHPKETRDRCALRAQLRGDAMLGTAFPAGRVLLVEQPGPWGHDGLTESRFDAEVAVELEKKAAAVGMRVLAIRRPGRTPRGVVRRWGIADCWVGAESLVWGTFDRDADLLDVPLDGTAGTPDDRPAYLVCAHSKRDACCAIRGRPLAAALAEERPGHVWECSHIGGHRFAATVLVLPLGLVYGQVLPFAAPEFVEAAERREVIGALLRGRVGMAPVAQAALAFGHAHLAVRDVDALRVVRTGRIADGEAVVRIGGPHGELDVTVRVEKVDAAGLSCGEPGPNSYLRFRPVLVAPVEP